LVSLEREQHWQTILLKAYALLMNGIDMDQAWWIKLLPDFIRVRIEGRHTLQKVLGNTGWLFADKIVRMGVGLFVGAWIARYLGPAQFGALNYSIAFVALFAPLATLGLDRIVIRNILREPYNKASILGSAFVLKLASGLLTLCLTVAIIYRLRPDDTLTHWLVGIAALGLIFQSFDTIDLWFQSEVRSQYSVYARGVAFAIMSPIKIIMVLASAQLIAFAWASFTEILIGAVGLVFFYRMSRQRLSDWQYKYKQARLLLIDSWPLILSGLSIAIYMKIDQVMLGEMAGNGVVGIYSAVAKISEIWYFIPLTIVSSVFPSIITTRNVDEKLYYARLQKLFSFMVLLSLSLSIPMTFLSSKVVTLIYGEHFAQGGAILAVHIWASLFVFLGVAQGPWDLAENLTKIALLRTSAGAVINITLNLILIPKYQAMGAAVATVFSYACSAYLLNAFSRKTRVIFIQQTKSLFFFNTLWRTR